MDEFRFYYPIVVRYSDLDPQWHVNNAKFMSYVEQARFAYLLNLGLIDGQNFLELPLIVADVHIAFLSPIFLESSLRVGMRVEKIGNKSLTMASRLEDTEKGIVHGTAEVVMVAYDYHAHASVPVSAEWRKIISEFEGKSF